MIDPPSENEEVKMLEDELRKVIEQGKLPVTVADKYLTMYVGNADWEKHIMKLHSDFNKRYGGDVEAIGIQMRGAISCATLLPREDRSTQIDPQNPQNLLFRCPSWSQYHEKNWFELFKKVIARDMEIRQWRHEALSLGIIDPIEYQPYCRQAFNWLYSKADESGAVTSENKEEMARKFRNIVWAYGGAVISYIFTKHEAELKKVLNWRSGYFFERVIFDVYTKEQVLKIKKTELDKTNQKLVKTIRID